MPPKEETFDYFFANNKVGKHSSHVCRCVNIYGHIIDRTNERKGVFLSVDDIIYMNRTTKVTIVCHCDYYFLIPNYLNETYWQQHYRNFSYIFD